MRMLKRWLNYSVATVWAAGCLSADIVARVQSFPLRDATGLITPQVKADAVKYQGRDAVRLTVDDRAGLALGDQAGSVAGAAGLTT